MDADLLVAGFGKGGKTPAAATGRQGKRVVMVEQVGRMYGGTCISIGCVPAKALMHQAETRRADGSAEQWYRQAVGGKDDLTTFLRQKNFQMLDTIDTVTVVIGRATFTGPESVEVTAGSQRLTITADTIVINASAVKVASKPVAQIAATPRARIVGNPRGLMKYVVDADTDQVLGAALLSVDSQEVITRP